MITFLFQPILISSSPESVSLGNKKCSDTLQEVSETVRKPNCSSDDKASLRRKRRYAQTAEVSEETCAVSMFLCNMHDDIKSGVLKVNCDPFCFHQDALVCPECGFTRNSLITVRHHVETKHGDKVNGSTLTKWNTRFFWRAKRGLRKISRHDVDRVLKEFRLLGRDRRRTLKVISRVLRLCLVKVAIDYE